MKIAGEIYATKKKDLLSPYFHIWAESYNPKQPYHQIQSDFSLSKEKFRKQPARLSLSNSRIDGTCKIINNEFVFVNARKLSEEAENFINQKEAKIERLRKEILDYVNEHFFEWDLLKVKDAFDYARTDKSQDVKEKQWQHIEKVMQEIREGKGK